MFSQEDVNNLGALIKEHGYRRVFVVGSLGAGKTIFARALAGYTGFACVELDRASVEFVKTKDRMPEDLGEVLDSVLTRQKPPYIIEHTELLDLEPAGRADLVVMLNPPVAEIMHSFVVRQQRAGAGSKKFSSADVKKMAGEVTKRFAKLHGKRVYRNDYSGIEAKALAVAKG